MTYQDLRPLRLKATKTSLYRLVAEYADLPWMRMTEFSKTPRVQHYALYWYDGTAHLSTVGGEVLLTINGENRRVYRPTLDHLRRFGMIEEVPNGN